MKKYASIALALAFGFLTLSSTGQEESYDAVYNNISREYVLNEDGSFDFREIKSLTLNTHYAFHRLFGETFIIYDPAQQQLKINESYTTMADGTVVTTPENAFNELLPRFADRTPAWNHLREMAITHTGLEVGATIHLDYSLHSDAGMMPFFMGKEEIKENVPVDEMHITVKVPEGESLRYRVLNIRTAPDIFEENGMTVYRWSFRSLSPLPADQYAYEYDEPVLFFSVARDMQWAYFRFVNQDAFRSPLPESLSAKAVECRKKNDDDLGLILKLRDIIIEGLNHKNIPGEYTGFSIRTPAETWQSGWATTAEKAVLLAEMCIAAGINAEPVAAIQREWFDEGQGNLYMFEDFFVQVNPKRMGRIYLSLHGQEDQNLLWNMDDYTLVQLDGAVESMRTFNEKGENADLSLAGTITLGDSLKLWGEFESTMTFSANPWFRLSDDSSYSKRLLDRKVKVEEFNIEKLTEKESLISFKTMARADTSANYLFLELPGFHSGVDSWRLGTTEWQRRSPLKLPYPISESYEYEIKFDEGMSYVGDKVDVKIGNDAGECSVEIRETDGKLSVRRELILYKELYQINEIRQFRELIERWNRSVGREIILKIAD